jgi:hypothetical protein
MSRQSLDVATKSGTDQRLTHAAPADGWSHIEFRRLEPVEPVERVEAV